MIFYTIFLPRIPRLEFALSVHPLLNKNKIRFAGSSNLFPDKSYEYRIFEVSFRLHRKLLTLHSGYADFPHRVSLRKMM